MVVPQVCRFRLKISCPTWKEEKAEFKRALHPGKKKIILFSKPVFSRGSLQAHPSAFFLKIKTQGAKIMIKSEPFQDLVTRILLAIKNLAVTRITGVGDILA